MSTFSYLCLKQFSLEKKKQKKTRSNSGLLAYAVPKGYLFFTTSDGKFIHNDSLQSLAL